MTIDSADDSKISNRTINTNRISNRTYDSKSNRITKLRRSLLELVIMQSVSKHVHHGAVTYAYSFTFNLLLGNKLNGNWTNWT